MATEGSKKRGWSLKKVMSKDTWRLSGLFTWKRVDHLHKAVMDDVVFKVVSVAEAVVLVSTLCFFLLCCGGQI